MDHTIESPFWKLRGKPEVRSPVQVKLERDFSRFAESGLPENLEEYLLEEYRIDVSTSLAGFELKNPFGKASGQLSMTAHQVREDAELGLSFVVLKTVIAEDPQGSQSMHEWAIRESRMVAERIIGTHAPREGWTITWKGRGWWHSFEDYLALIRESCAIGNEHNLLVIPSCKYHLPMSAEEPWRIEEYEYTTQQMVGAWRSVNPDLPMPIEKDFSPTLAGSDRAKQKQTILDWLRQVPRLIRQSSPDPLAIGLKLFNTIFEVEFQLDLIRTVLESQPPGRADFLTIANRLFDPAKEFDGKIGVAYGGPDLSDRNLSVLDSYREKQAAGLAPPIDLPISGTGDICSGRIALEYALRGCSTFQIHTYFQLPATEYVMKHGSKTARALHMIYFHPTEGFIAWMHHLGKVFSLQRPGGELYFRDIVSQVSAA